MAARTGRLLQNQNLNVHVNGAGTVSGKDFTGQRKARAGGRKPLGDLSNAGNLINQFDGKKTLDGSSNTGKTSVSQAPKLLKSKNLESDKRIASKASEKSLTRSRKALSDISNSGKQHVPEIKNKNTLKLSSLIEESLHPSAIAEEQILHDHKKCIKSQFETAHVNQFLKTVGLEDDSDDHTTISFELSAISKLNKSESAYLELEEVPEQLPEVQSLSALHGSPAAHCKTPSLSSYRTMWNDSTVNFKLIDTPKMSKN
ncbi:hypothetical protein CR513_02198 [Mucuna pruriens]|uniref:Protein PATRONUS 2 n=1 Tax=Mucuna pruriens TaxID=157652 RepID=A0A371ID71_MUCPR|nr:hypothetical protein CR513_02198 [Mucuna pruriens]